MNQTITFHINPEDKIKLKEIAEKQRLSLSTYCRYFLLKKLQEIDQGGKSD